MNNGLSVICVHKAALKFISNLCGIPKPLACVSPLARPEDPFVAIGNHLPSDLNTEGQNLPDFQICIKGLPIILIRVVSSTKFVVIEITLLKGYIPGFRMLHAHGDTNDLIGIVI